MGACDILGIRLAPQAPASSSSQAQTRDCFSYKWQQRHSYESQAFLDKNRAWLLERYCQGDPLLLQELLGHSPKVILDAGCGSGFSSALLFGRLLNQHHYLGIDISDSIDVAKQRFDEQGLKGEFLQSSLNDFDAGPEKFDLIFSEGVLHHTDDTFKSLSHLSKQLRIGGHFLFYVYKKKAPLREFTDDYIRQQIQGLSNEKAWNALLPLTKLGMQLGQMDLEIDIAEDIDVLGIKKGKLDLQRFFYWNICKAFYHPDYSEDENNHMNFDWYRPLNCHRHTEDEVREACLSCGLEIQHMDIQDSGISVVAKKTSSTPT